MRRIIIIGCGGAGKSTFARRLGERLDIPVHHLDREFWKPGWIPSDRDTFLARLKELALEPAWIMDGNFGGTLDYRLSVADTVIFLDYSTITCLTGAVRRYWQWRGKSRPDMADGNSERLDRSYVMWILRYRTTSRPRLLARLSKLPTGQRVYQLVSREHADRFLREAV
ncbi:MAG: hypothetical protein HUJ31_16940 [Pseudomonadales bacterium]|nr:hypothetical protein [Pseudomonadales bacterium]